MNYQSNKQQRDTSLVTKIGYYYLRFATGLLTAYLVVLAIIAATVFEYIEVNEKSSLILVILLCIFLFSTGFVFVFVELRHRRKLGRIFFTSVVIIWGIVSLIIWLWPGLDLLPPMDNLNIPYILSAISQSLAAILALVFTISLVVAQLSSRYSYRIVPGVFDFTTISYIVLFIIAILLPLWVLAYPYPSGIESCMILASACLLFLIPHFLRLRNKLSPMDMISKIKDSAISKMIIQSQTADSSDIETLDNFIMSSYTQKDYDTFDKGVEALVDIVNATRQIDNASKRKYIEELLFKRLDDVISVTMKDPRAPTIILDAMFKLFELFSNDDNEQSKSIVHSIISLLGDIGIMSLINDSDTVALKVVNVLGRIVDFAHFADVDTQNIVISTTMQLGEAIGVTAIDKSSHKTTYEVIDTVYKKSFEFIQSGMYKVATQHMHALMVLLKHVGEEKMVNGAAEHAKNAIFQSVDIPVEIGFIPNTIEKVIGLAINDIYLLGDYAISFEGLKLDSEQTTDISGLISRIIESIGSLASRSSEMENYQALGLATDYLGYITLDGYMNDYPIVRQNLVYTLAGILNAQPQWVLEKYAQNIYANLMIIGILAVENDDIDIQKRVIEAVSGREKSQVRKDFNTIRKIVETQIGNRKIKLTKKTINQFNKQWPY